MKLAAPSQKSIAIDILTKSFDDNKSVNYVVKQDSQRLARIRGLMEYSFDVCHRFGDVWFSDDEQACALILLPDKKKTTLLSILWDIKLALSVIGIDRVSKVLARESKIKAFHPKEPFSYLWFIGVTPDKQNKGTGSHLLQELADHYQKSTRPIYLETSVDRNIPWYTKNGFEIFKSIELSYTLYMLRRPIISAVKKEELIQQN